MSIYQNILQAISQGEKLMAVLIDPDKFQFTNAESFITKVNNSIATHVFVGGSTVGNGATQVLVNTIKKYSKLPLVLFPGDVTQIVPNAHALLFLSLLSGRNPEYLIGKHVKAVPMLKETELEVIPTGYILIDGGKQSAVTRVTNTQALARDSISEIINTAKAGELLGLKLMYLEAGSGANISVPECIIEAVKNELSIPIIVGGGITTKSQLNNAYKAGADMVVIGTAFEEDEAFFAELN